MGGSININEHNIIYNEIKINSITTYLKHDILLYKMPTISSTWHYIYNMTYDFQHNQLHYLLEIKYMLVQASTKKTTSTKQSLFLDLLVTSFEEYVLLLVPVTNYYEI